MQLETLGNNEVVLGGILVLVLLSVIIQVVVLIKLTQIQNNQKYSKTQNHQNPADDGKRHGNQHQNKKTQENRANQNNRPAQQQGNQNKPQHHSGAKKEFERIASNAVALKDTNAQLANRPRNSQNKPKVYSERTAVSQKQERPSNTPIKQQEMPANADVESEKSLAAAALIEKPVTETVKTAEVKTEQSGSVQYGRR
jgi:hypothetical protein